MYHNFESINLSIADIIKSLRTTIPIEYIVFPSGGFSAIIDNLVEVPGTGFDFYIINSKQWSGDHINIVKSAIDSNKRCVFVFKYMSHQILNQDLRNFLLQLEGFRSRHPYNFNYVFMSYEKVIADDSEFNVLAKYYNSYEYNAKDSEYLLNLLPELGLEDLDKSTVKLIDKFSGKLVVIAKSILRDFVVDEKLKDLFTKEALFNRDFFKQYPGLMSRLAKIVSILPNKYLDTLIKLSRSEPVTDLRNVSDLYNMGVVNDKHQIRSHILAGYFKHMTMNGLQAARNSSEVASVNIGNISVDTTTYEVFERKTPLNVFLTNSEYKLIEVLHSDRNKVVSKESLAKAIWENEYLEKYSEWALDKLISRTRMKLGDRRPYKIIVTLKSRGVYLNV